ncbi:conserved hypothetical protein [Neospora caninum Liverpool]|uniref:Fcf2 pre-rRNA processing protein n=1 Tax=Neospora caninum (strain Liverpool) TaxID=572307 RepID=F0VAJ4_NEOCL|nr:conserved hypothetical protein [Neospora caninum Liverpool]CBZ50683.1 conserved hypothetical protein [Neospora caninum Liverpool]CEL65295.1 TPA: Fcf2 pre-rRNA processing protein [Neospora caninum Liverpool]|eukprot:XP_003880716.1 conserved hypothetical protein [Neospora caninum Liverpool]
MTAASEKRSPGNGGKKNEEKRAKAGVNKQLRKERLRAIEAASRLLPPPPQDDACAAGSAAGPSSSSLLPSSSSASSSSLCSASHSSSSSPASTSCSSWSGSADPALASLSLLECAPRQPLVVASGASASSGTRPTISQTSLEHLDPNIDKSLLCFSSQRVMKKRQERRLQSSLSSRDPERPSAVPEESQEEAGQAESAEGGMHELPRLDLTSAPGRFAFHRVDVDARAAACVTLDAKHRRQKKLIGSSAGCTPQLALLCPSPSCQNLSGTMADVPGDRPAKDSASLLLPPSVKANAELATLVDAGKLQQQERLAKRDAAKAHLANWYEIPAQELSPGLRRELKVLELRGHMDPKKFHKEGLKIRSERTERRIGSGVYVQHTAHLHVCTVKDGFGSGGGVGAGRESEAVGATKRRKGKGGSLLSSLLKDTNVETWTRKKVRDLGSAKFEAKGRKNSWKTLKKRR